MSRLAPLKAATSLSDVAKLLDFKPKAVSYILYKRPAAKYKTFRIPKRNGGERTIKAPVDALKLLQRRLSDLLQDCVYEINTARRRKDRTAHGFKRKRSTITNARQHRHRRWVFNLDLEDFFPSINFGRVRGFLLKNRDFELHEDVATVITQIACHENSLPQGSPCSPVISNLVAHLLDMRLVKLARKTGCTYSRYADDLTFSTNKKEFPSNIAVPSGTEDPDSHLWLPGKALQKIIEHTGFRINANKTHQMYRTSRQDVTGLVVNKKINVRWKYRHTVRAMVHSLVKSGTFQILGVTHKDGHAVLDKRPGTLNELHGMLGFIDSIDVYNKTHTSDALSDERSSSEKVYREFLIYSTFYAAQAPVVICEGETDNVYLTHAIRSLVAEFPALAEVMPDQEIRLKVRLYKYPKTGSVLIWILLGLGALIPFGKACQASQLVAESYLITKSSASLFSKDVSVFDDTVNAQNLTKLKCTFSYRHCIFFANRVIGLAYSERLATSINNIGGIERRFWRERFENLKFHSFFFYPSRAIPFIPTNQLNVNGDVVSRLSANLAPTSQHMGPSVCPFVSVPLDFGQNPSSLAVFVSLRLFDDCPYGASQNESLNKAYDNQPFCESCELPLYLDVLIGLTCIFVSVCGGVLLVYHRYIWGTTLFILGFCGFLSMGFNVVFCDGAFWRVLVSTDPDRCQQKRKAHTQESFQHLIIVPHKYLLTSYNYWGTVSAIGSTQMANVLDTEKQVAAISALAEGSSIRSIERMTGVHRDTIMRLGVRVGQGCATLLDRKMRDLSCRHLEFDEIWGFIGKKERHLRPDDNPEFGDAWTFCAIDADTKLVPAFKVGKRDAATANAFVSDIAGRLKNRVQISSDALRAYVEAVEQAFGANVDFAQIVKAYVFESDAERHCSAPEIVITDKKRVSGHPDMDMASTSYVERLNGTTRLHMRRLTRLTYAFSKKLENFEAAVALHFAYYNFVKRHNTLRVTPAMAAGIERDFWTVENLVEAAA